MKGKRIMTTKQYIIPQTEIIALQHSIALCNNVSLNTTNESGNSWTEAF